MADVFTLSVTRLSKNIRKFVQLWIVTDGYGVHSYRAA